MRPQADQPGDSPRSLLASWGLSVLFHLALLLVLAWLLQTAPAGLREEPAREAGVVLKHFTPEGEYYEGESEQQVSAKQQATETTAVVENTLAALATEPAELDPRDRLPELPTIGPSQSSDNALGSAAELTQGAVQPQAARGGKARVRIYNVEGEGRKFVFVFDRSVSMTGAPLASAKGELIRAIESLDSTHQFQIIFFHHAPRSFDLSGGQNRIPFADERTKAIAAKFVGGMTADGGTDRYAALSMAVGMRPDVIFFLTDVDDPMSALEVERIRRRNRETTAIHTIEFGQGPTIGEDNFLKRIARENRGAAVYVDISKLGD